MTLTEIVRRYAQSMTFSDLLWDHTDPANDTIPWRMALEAADLHSCLYDFRKVYGHLQGERIDTGELLRWLGY